jgi:hypothetical protein
MKKYEDFAPKNIIASNPLPYHLVIIVARF